MPEEFDRRRVLVVDDSSPDGTADVVRRQLSEVIAPSGLTLQQYNVLRILRGATGDGLCRNEVGARLVKPVPDVTRLLDRMEQMHLIERQRGGEVRLESPGAVLRLPGVLAEPSVALSTLSGTLGWRIQPRDGAGSPAIVEVRSAGLNVSNADLAGSLGGRWRSSGSSALGEIDLAASFTRINASRVAAYLPLAIDPGVRGWVARAVGSAGRTEAELRIRGDLADFPFRDPTRGEFRVQARLDQTALQFMPQWPAIDRLRGTLVFDRAAMELKAQSAETRGVVLRDIHAQIGELSRQIGRAHV